MEYVSNYVPNIFLNRRVKERTCYNRVCQQRQWHNIKLLYWRPKTFFPHNLLTN